MKNGIYITKLLDLAKQKKLWYLAHNYFGSETQNFLNVNQIAAVLFIHGVSFFSPVSMSHPIQKQLKNLLMKRNIRLQSWYDFDLVIANQCDGIILPYNWMLSEGCRIEKAFFERNYKDVVVFSKEFYDDLLNYNIT